jgi:hypothetical protein
LRLTSTFPLACNTAAGGAGASVAKQEKEKRHTSTQLNG